MQTGQSLIVIGSLALSLAVHGQAAPGQGSPPAAPAAPVSILEQIKKSVVFIEGHYSATETQEVNGVSQQVTVQKPLSGTAFLIFVPEPRLGAEQGLTFLVTNKHMIREPGPNGDLGEGPYFKTMFARVNTKQMNADGTQFGMIMVQVVDESRCLQWFVDQDDSVDLAITPVGLTDTADFRTIPESLFATKQLLTEKKADENDEVLFTGLFASYAGDKKNYPIVRHGKLALIPQERIPFDDRHPDKREELYLADVMSFGGNSGSPVFLRLGGLREGAGLTIGYSYYLLGVMQGYFGAHANVVVDVAEKKGIAIENSGIAAVIPSDKIAEVLETPRARAYIEKAVGKKYFENGKFDDAEKSYKMAIDLLENSAPEHSDLAWAFDLYAQLLQATNRSAQAKILEEQAAKIRSNVQTDRMTPRF